jgi:hypothetical protein
MIRFMFTRSTVSAVAEIDPETLRQWRDRLGFALEAQTAGGHSLYSLAQICGLRLAVLMKQFGLRAGVAVDAAKQLVPVFDKLIAKIDRRLAIPHIVVIHRDGDECGTFQVFCEAQIGDVLSIAGGVATVVDLLVIAHHVVGRLQDEGHPIVETDREAIADGIRAFRRGFAR